MSPSLRHAEIVALAAGTRREAGVSPRAVVMSPTIAAGLGLRIRVAPTLHVRAYMDLRNRAVVIREIDDHANMDIAHELGHWAIRKIAGLDLPDEELLATRLGVALLVPPAVSARLGSARRIAGEVCIRPAALVAAHLRRELAEREA